jgi:hypothetical protein
MFGVRDLRAVLAGAFLCGVVMDGVAVAQDRAEVTEDLGGSYLLARRTTGQGSIIETLLYASRPIVTDIVMPAPGDATGANANAAATTPQPATGRASPVAASFGGVLLSAEMSDGYLILHRTRAEGPVTHDIFRDGEKIATLSDARAAAPGRNSFAFETAGDRFIVHMTQPDGTRVRATSTRGQMSEQVIEPVAAARPSATVAPSFVAQPPAKPAALEGGISRDAPASGPAQSLAKPGSARAASVHPQTRARPQAPVAAAPVAGFYGTPPTQATTPVARPLPAVDTVNRRSAPVTAAKPVVQAARPARPASPGAALPQRRVTAGQP